VRAHLDALESTLYTTLSMSGLAPGVLVALRRGHQKILSLLNTLDTPAAYTADSRDVAEALRRALRDNALREEREVFPQAALALGGELESISLDFRHTIKQRIRGADVR
jgi:hypothetical protein